MRLVLLALVCLVVLVSTAAAADEPRQTKPVAERNLLSAQRMLTRWRAGLVDPRTGLLRNNVWARCSGRGSAVRGRHTHFSCVVGHRRTRVTVTYLVLPRNGFEVRNRRVSAVPARPTPAP